MTTFLKCACKLKNISDKEAEPNNEGIIIKRDIYQMQCTFHLPFVMSKINGECFSNAPFHDDNAALYHQKITVYISKLKRNRKHC